MISASILGSGCGGGGGGSNGAVPPANPPPPAQNLPVEDSLPTTNVTTMDPWLEDIAFAILGYSDFSLSFSGDCADGIAVRRSTRDLNDATFDELLDQRLRCPGLGENQSHTATATAVRSDGSRFESFLDFATGISASPGTVAQDSAASPAASIEAAFANYVATALFPELNLPPPVELLITLSVLDLFSSLTNLNQPNAIYSVTSERLSYGSRAPDGNQSTALTGLVAAPTAGGSFTPRDQVIVLLHSTGSTPGDLDPTNAWYLLANVLASYGYLVVAPDNWGRGGTSAEVETYLMANRTAANTADFLRRVLEDPAYDAVKPQTVPLEATLVGYSQGGHSAIAAWHALTTNGPTDIAVRNVYAGGAPYDLYETFRGVVEHVDGSCSGGPYCRYVDSATVVPFAANRVLPGFLAYTDTGLAAADIIQGSSLLPVFAAGFLANDAEYDKLKLVLQLSSFGNITNPLEAYGTSTAALNLYHSPYDRLVPEANTRALVGTLDTLQSVDYRSGICDTPELQAIFNLTTIVGVVHSLCGLAMMDDVLGDLR